MTATAKTSHRAWHGGSSKAGSGMQRATVHVVGELPRPLLVTIFTRPWCGCGSHTGTECPDCGALVCQGNGHGRHECITVEWCQRCEGSGKVAGNPRGVSWPEWQRRQALDSRGERVGGILRFPPPPAVVAIVRAGPCLRCEGTGRASR
jgi:hypothetical protein